jgi:hypothetical protein
VDGKRLLAIYLNDHLSGAAAGKSLAQRSLGSNRGTPYGETLAWLLEEVEQDRQTLLEIMRTVGAKPDPFKQAAALVTERVGRLKLNGRLLSYSPLSRLVELEGLVLGVRGKLSMWETLAALELPELAMMPFDALIRRAETQIERLQEHRASVSSDAFLG